MKAWDFNEWHQTLTRTQTYFHHRICGDACDRELIEAWRCFYQTHEPLVRILAARHGLREPLVEPCIEQIWMGILVGLPKLRPPVTYDSFLHWLRQLVQTKASELIRVGNAQRSPVLAWCGSSTVRAGSAATRPLPAAVNSRLFQLRIVEQQPVEDVAQALGLTPAQVADREHDMLRKILAILVRLDA